jgi:type VI secretion system protein ImpB
MASKESLQKKLSGVRPPRVHITYDVETGGAIEKREIPFVVGVLSDLSGQPETPLPPLKARKFINVDKDTLASFRVNNRLSEDDSLLGVELRFKSMADFEPGAVAKQIVPLRRLLEIRNALHNVRTSLIGNDTLDSILQEILKDQDALERIKAESASPSVPEKPKET